MEQKDYKKYIECDAAKEAVCTIILHDGIRDALKSCIDDVPAADVRPVVLCGDCKYCRKVDEFEYWCDGFCSPERLVRKDDFCSHGNKDE